MSLNKVTAQEFAVKILRSHLEKKRIAHTYLLTGKKESGKEDVALAFAQALNCLSNHAFEECACVSCRKIEAGNHPDVRIMGSEAKARSIKIEEVRDAIGAASLKPYEGKWKVFILLDADRLTADAQNALLKTLEEPPANTLFIFLVENKSNLLETIQSRSFEVRLKPLHFSEEGGAGFIAGMWQENWEDILDAYQSQSREELKGSLELLMSNLREEIRNSESTGRGIPVPKIVEAISVVCETKDAVDGNVNQKLALSRLAVNLRKILPLRSLP